jgi:D-alanine-D-alanine ligase
MKPLPKKKNPKRKTRVAVLMGGPSSEHDVSLKSGENVLKQIDRNDYDSFGVRITREGEWEIQPGDLRHEADVAFIALHGTYGEDGTIQSILDAVNLPYTGSHALPSALAMNKYLTLRLLQENGFVIPHSFLISRSDWNRNPFKIFDQIKNYIGYPMVVKPNANGSSVGVHIVGSRGELVGALESIFEFSREALAQNLIVGRELTCGVLDHGWPDSAFPLMPTEIIPKVSPFFDYRAKYEPGGSEEITPARLPQPFVDSIRRTATNVHKAVGASGFSRTDFMLDRNGRAYVLEINTIPGLTTQSLIPKAAEATGIGFPDLIDRIITAALNKYHPREMCEGGMTGFFRPRAAAKKHRSK